MGDTSTTRTRTIASTTTTVCTATRTRTGALAAWSSMKAVARACAKTTSPTLGASRRRDCCTGAVHRRGDVQTCFGTQRSALCPSELCIKDLLSRVRHLPVRHDAPDCWVHGGTRLRRDVAQVRRARVYHSHCAPSQEYSQVGCLYRSHCAPSQE